MDNRMNNLIAIIDDCEEDREIYKHYLKKNTPNLNIIECSSGHEALEKIINQSLDCILLDYQLIDMTALELLTTLKISATPIIVLTGQGSETIALDSIKHGAADYLIKSNINEEILINAIQSSIKKFELKNKEEARQKKFVFEATHDALTQVYNRKYLEEYARRLISKSLRHHLSFALLYIDLDKFKIVNDTLGHLVGDELLIQFTRRIKKILREEDVLGRIGGDEFIIFVDYINQPNEVANIANKIIDAASKTFKVNKHSLNIGASIGIYYYEGAHSKNITFKTALKMADKALYQVKSQGGEGFQFFSNKQEKHYAKNLLIENDLLSPNTVKQLKHLLIPTLDINRKTLMGYQVKLIWDHPLLGVLSAKRFLKMVSVNGLLEKIIDWQFNDIKNGLTQFYNYSNYKIFVPTHTYFLNSNLLPTLIKKNFRHQPLLLNRIVIQVREKDLLQLEQHAIEQLLQLKALGCQLGINEFASEDSNLVMMSQLGHIDYIKIKLTLLKSNTLVALLHKISEALNAQLVFNQAEKPMILTWQDLIN